MMSNEQLPLTAGKNRPIKMRKCRKGCGREALPPEDGRGKICKPCDLEAMKKWRRDCKKITQEDEPANWLSVAWKV